MLSDIKSLSRSQLESFVSELGEKPFRATQIFRWIHHDGAAAFSAMTNLSAALRNRLAALARISRLEIADCVSSTDGTRKLLLRSDADVVESVLIPMDSGLTLCISSQVGCSLACAFCRTAAMRRRRDLDAAEIVDQVYRCAEVARGSGDQLGNLVFMGMGEPMENLDNVLRAIAILTDEHGMAFSTRRITVSTSGVVPGIERLGRETQVNLAVSLNATTQELRLKLMPVVARRHPLDELLAALRAFPVPQRRRITMEYVLLSGVNDTPAEARRLVRILEGVRCKVNLIPFNQWPGARFSTPPARDVEAFAEVVRSARIATTVRESRGADIFAACGLLASRDGENHLAEG